MARRKTKLLVSWSMAGRPGGRCSVVHFLATSCRCHLRSVSGRRRNECHASRGSSLLAAARNALSAVRYKGRFTCRRRMATWWRRTATSSSASAGVRSSERNSARIRRRRDRRETRARRGIVADQKVETRLGRDRFLGPHGVRDGDRAELQRRARSKAEPARVAQRARIVLLAEQGLTGPAIAERVGCSEPTVTT